ncbi:TetR/AcrR family transcriptional regulator [Sphingobium sp. MK2]|uniref:TetR/AcrR family transcriptional regulator n=1 Tax=Sphingobium sp. MK2 TaxID=3116540 RepID=UPI0032E35AC4
MAASQTTGTTQAQPATQPPKATRRSAKGLRTRMRIVDAAERLFGQNSYETVSQRDIADEAGVLIGLVTHHYPNKISLFDAVIARRAEELNSRRLERLKAVDQTVVDAIIDAFNEPLLELVGGKDEGWSNYARLMSKMAYSEVGLQATERYYGGTVKAFLDVLHAAMPGVDRMAVAHAFIYSIEILLTSIYMPGRFAAVAGLDAFEPDAREVYDTVRPFVLGGIKAL